MLANDRTELFFSQSALGTYLNCQLKFRRRYLDGLYWPGTWSMDETNRERMERGSEFHLLAQRYYTDGTLPASSCNITETVREWLTRLVSFRPYLPELYLAPEQELRLQREQIKLVAKFDLLLQLPDGRVVIYDWKTTGNAPKQEYWQKHLQTMVYQYLLCAAGEACLPYGKINPDQVSMIYWNPQFPGKMATMAYSVQQMHKDEAYLTAMVAEIQGRDTEQFLATSDEKRCRHCEYAPICLGERAAEVELEEEDLDLDLDWESIEQIAWE